MSRPPDSFNEFCGFHPNASSFKWRYVMDEATGTFTPCWEMMAVSGLSVPLLFITIINLCLVSRGFPRFDKSSIYWMFTVRVGVCIGLLMSLFISTLLHFVTELYVLPIPQVLEYFLVFLVWAVYCSLWISSLSTKSWTSTTSLSVSHFLASKAFIIIISQRWIRYGFTDPRCFVVFTTFPLILIYFITKIAEWRIRKTVNRHNRLENEYEVLPLEADEEASFFSKMFFLWTNPLISKGYKKQLNVIEDVFELPPSLQVAGIERQLIENAPSYYSDGEHFSITRALLRTFGVNFFLLVIPRLLSDLFTFAGPILLHLLITTLEDPTPNDSSWWYAAAMMFTTFGAVLCSAHFNFQVQKMSLRVRAATVTSIVDKLLRVPLFELGANSTGKIINFVSSDVDRIVNFCNSFHAFWSLPVQLTIALFLLYREVSYAFLAGLAAAVILIPINKIITTAIGKRSEKMMHWKDLRVKLITETMSGMRTVKMSGWEEYFEKRIAELRKQELEHLKARKYLDAVCVYLWASAPLIITVSILSAYTLVLHETLTAAKVFTSLALVNILIVPLNAFPWVLNGLVEALVSLRRLDTFFLSNDIDYPRLYSLSQQEDQLIQIEDASLSWRKSEGGVKTIGPISFTANKGTIVGVGGAVGSGKSTLLLGLLGEAKVVAKKIGVRQNVLDEGFAYVGQQPWLSRGTIRENIVCGKPFDATLYTECIQATCLSTDIKALPGGDEYEISENGATLSGGQRVRVMMARALYQDNCVYLLDDPFASLDKEVAEYLWTEAIDKMIRGRGKVAVVSTHDTSLLRRADEVLMLRADGSVQKGKGEVFMTQRKKNEETNQGIDDADTLPLYVAAQEEEKQGGVVRMSVYGWYVSSTGKIIVSAILFSIFGMQLFKNTADWWLTKWTEGQNSSTDYTSAHEFLFKERIPRVLKDDEWDRSIYFLSVYSIIATANTLFTLARAFLFAKGGVIAAKHLHERLLHKLLQAPISWWDRTPAGRVINRLAADVYTVDDSLPFQMNILLASLASLTGALIITVIGLPTLLPLIVILFIIYYFIQRHYRMTTVELKRLSTLSLSPLYSSLNDIVEGLVTIRAHRFAERMTSILRMRVTNVIRTHFSSLAASQWLTVRLSSIAVTVVSLICFAAVLQHRLHFVDSGMVGLAVTYALSMTSLLNGLLGSFIETEKEMVSVERIKEYSEKLPVEEVEGQLELTEEVQGSIELVGVSVRYEKSLPLALNSVNVKIEPGQKVAILGRTGSGKSTIFQCLLRAVELTEGVVTVDGMDISKLPLKVVRRIFGVVPQHPFLFSGTLAENLAVDCHRSDRNAMTHLVRVAQLDSLLERIGGLDGEIEEGGRNLSVGERQIVSLCRLLLSKPKIILIDEATAHMDDATRKKVFSLLNACLPLSTLLSIIHRPHSLEDYDLVIRMEAGRIIRTGSSTDDLMGAMEVDEVPSLVGENKKEELPRGAPKSGRWWKSTRTAKTSAIKKDKPLKTSWQKKMEIKAKNDNVKKLQQQIRDKIAEEKAAKIERRKEQEQRRLENERKAEVVQVIKNTHKLKKAKKKQLRKIEKRDVAAL